MKKLLMITLSLLLFTILISPVQSKRLGPLDRPLQDYNNLSLRQIFEDGQLVTNPNFDTNTTGWTAISGVNTWLTGGFLKNTANGTQISSIARQSTILTVGQKHYINARVRVTNSLSTQVGFNEPNNIMQANPVANTWYELSGVITAATANIWLRHYYANTNTADAYVAETTYVVNDTVSYGGIDYINILSSTGILPTNTTYWRLLSSYNKVMEIDYAYAYNLTALGIPTATKIEMDNLYSDYLKYKDMMTATDVMLIVGQLGAFVWSLVVSFEVFGFVLWEYALFGIGAGFIGYLALKIIQKKAGDDNGDSD